MHSPEPNASTATLPPPDPRRWWALTALSLLLLLVAVDATVLILAIPAIAEDLGSTGNGLLWITDIYSFILAGLLVLMGNLGDRWGRRRLLLVGMIAFAGASALAAVADSTAQLIAARALLGVAGATLMPSTLSLLRTTFTTPRERTFALGVWAAIGSSGAAIGPLVGGFLLEHYWWGSVFLINIPVVVIAVPAVLLSVRESKNPDAGPIDVPSALLSIAGVVIAIYGVKELARFGVAEPVAWAALVVGALIIWAFIRRQSRVTYPLVDIELFRQKALSGALSAVMFAIFGVVALLFFLALYLQTVEDASPLEAGFQLVPLVVASAIAAPNAVHLVARWGRRTVASFALAVEAAGLALSLAVLSQGVGPALWIAMVLIGIGDGLALTTLIDSILAAAPEERAGAASAVSETSYEVGGALGIAIIGSVVTLAYRTSLALPAGLPPDAADRAGDSVTSAAEVVRDNPNGLGAAVQSAAFDAFHTAYFSAAVLASVLMLAGAVIVRLTLPSRDAERAAAAAAP